MKKQNVVRALRDAEYRDSLSTEEQALLPAHPGGAIELSDDDLANLAGGSHCCQCSHVVSVCVSYCESCWTGGTACCC